MTQTRECEVAVIGGGLKGIANIWHRARTGEWPRHIKDAGNVLNREAAIPGSRFERSMAGDNAHRDLRGREMSMIFQSPRLALNPIRKVGK